MFLMVDQDYYAALLFNRLMGTTVLSASVAQTPTPDPSSPVRAYAHCHRDSNRGDAGVVTVLLINLGGQANVTIVDQLQTDMLGPATETGVVDIYRLAPPRAAGRTSHQVQVRKAFGVYQHVSIFLQANINSHTYHAT